MTGQTDITKIRMGPEGEKVEGGKEGETFKIYSKICQRGGLLQYWGKAIRHDKGVFTNH